MKGFERFFKQPKKVSTGYMTRKYEFDAGHRVMHERVKCFNVHGHRYVAELTFAYDEMHSIGYALDFKEAKRTAGTFFDKYWDHGFFANPHDKGLIEVIRGIKNVDGRASKLHLMNLMGQGEFCNPSAENIAKEMFFACSVLMDNPENCNLRTHHIRLYETPNCWVDCYRDTFSDSDWSNLDKSKFKQLLLAFKSEVGSLEYDERKATEKDLEIKDTEN